MNKLLLAILLFSITIPTLTFSEQLRPERDIKYLGAFRVPTNSSSNYSWGWVDNHSFVFNPSGGTLISPSMVISGHKKFGHVTEFSIPTPIISNNKTLSELNISTTVNDWTDITEGKWDIGRSSPRVSGMAIIAAQGLQSKDKIYWLTTDWYNPPTTPIETLGMSDLDFATPNAKGPWIIHADGIEPKASRTSRYLFNIPTKWADTNIPGGYYLASGENKINSGGSLGACIYAIKTWTTDVPSASGADIDAIELLCPGSVSSHRRNFNHTDNDDYSWNDGQNDAVWVQVGERSAIMFSGNVATLSASLYGDCDATTENCQYYKSQLPGDADQVINPNLSCGDTCEKSPDACSSGHDVNSEPYYRVLWLYNPEDLSKVANGTMESWQPQPYAKFNLEPYFWTTGRCVSDNIGGIAYDSVNQRVFITELKVDGTESSFDKTPIVHVFQLTDSGLGADTTPPPSVNTVSNDGSGGLSWEGVKDDSGLPVTYIVKRDGKPIIITDDTSYLDDVYNRFIGFPNHQYTITAMDSVGNSVDKTNSTPFPTILSIK